MQILVDNAGVAHSRPGKTEQATLRPGAARSALLSPVYTCQSISLTISHWFSLPICSQGFDIVLGTNHFGTVALTQQLLPSLQAGAPSRVVVLTAAAEALAPPIAWDDIGGCDTENKGMPEARWRRLFSSSQASLIHR